MMGHVTKQQTPKTTGPGSPGDVFLRQTSVPGLTAMFSPIQRYLNDCACVYLKIFNSSKSFRL